MYKNVLFDLDGTLMNTFSGIYNSFEYAFKNLDLVFPGASFVKETIGIPLTSVFENQLGFTQETSTKAIWLFRDYYGKKGKFETCVYNGIQETLDLLKEKEYLLGIATLKREQYAREMICHQNWSSYFSTIHGMDEKFLDSKVNLIRKCMMDLDARKEDTILVGDGVSDLLGAKEIGIDFMAAIYGFGLSLNSLKNFSEKDISYIAHTGDEIGKILTTK